MFTQGQKVVCVDDEFPVEIACTYAALPRRNEVYTVRDIYMGHDTVRRDEVCVLLEELINPLGAISGIEKGFRADRFAPLIPTDLEEEHEEEEAGQFERQEAAALWTLFGAGHY